MLFCSYARCVPEMKNLIHITTVVTVTAYHTKYILCTNDTPFVNKKMYYINALY